MHRPGARCAYATRPTERPDCQLTAVLAYGDVPLCPSCDTRRSTLGKGQRPRPLPSAAQVDPLDLITDAHVELQLIQRNLHAAVARARQRGRTWQAVADRLGCTRQAAQQRFHPP